MKAISVLAIVVAAVDVSSAAEVIPRLHDEYDPQKWPKAELKLSTAATLKDMFDSGLRPYRFPGLENTTLEAKHLDLPIELGSGRSLPPIPAEMIRIKPFHDGEIATIEGFTPKLTLEQARNEMLKWLPYDENSRTEKDLDEYLAAVKGDYLDFDDPYRGRPDGCGIGWREPGFQTLGGGPKCGFGFRKTASPTHPLRLHFGFEWGLNRPTKDRGAYRPHPIEPPPGYEDVDMTAPKKIGPDSTAEILRSQGIDIGETGATRRENGGASERASTARVSRDTTAMEVSPDADRPVPRFEWPWIVVGLLVIGVVAISFGTYKRRSAS